RRDPRGVDAGQHGVRPGVAGPDAGGPAPDAPADGAVPLDRDELVPDPPVGGPAALGVLAGLRGRSGADDGRGAAGRARPVAPPVRRAGPGPAGRVRPRALRPALRLPGPPDPRPRVDGPPPGFGLDGAAAGPPAPALPAVHPD